MKVAPDSLGTRSALVYPILDALHELLMTERWHTSSFAGIPSPEHEWVMADVLN
jgi:hypothetical protein